MSTVIVTGAAGLIGSESVKRFAQAGLKVVGIDNDLRRWFFGDGACRRLFARTAWRPRHDVKQTVTDIFNWVRAHERELQPLV